MTAMLSILYLLATGVAAEAGRFSIHYQSGSQYMRSPILGSNPDDSLWLYLAEGNLGKSGSFETISKVKSSKPLKIASPSPSMSGIYWSGLFIEKNNTVTEFDLKNHGRQSGLGGNLSYAPNSILLSGSYQQLIGLGTNGHAWLWDPIIWDAKKEWIDLGGKFSKSPVGIRNPFENDIQLDLFGISTEKKLLHQVLKLDDDDNWIPKFKEWEIVDDGDYSGQVRLTYPLEINFPIPPTAFSIFALDDQRGLKYKRASANGFSEWQSLGGGWTEVPAVFELSGNRLEICGRSATNNAYWYKARDGTNWEPEGQKWRYVGDSFASEPALVMTGVVSRTNKPYMLVAGVADNSSLLNQAYIGGGEEGGIFPDAWHSDIEDVRKPSKSNRYRDEEL